MRRGIAAPAWLLGLALAAGGCQETTSGPAVSDYQKQRDALVARHQAESGSQGPRRSASAPAGEADETRYGASIGAYRYDPIGKRDPFRSFVVERGKEEAEDSKGPLEQFDLGQLDLTGLVWKSDNRRALVQDPSGRSYIVRVGDPIGKNEGVIVEIDDTGVVVREAYVDFHGERTTKEIVMRVRQSQGG